MSNFATLAKLSSGIICAHCSQFRSNKSGGRNQIVFRNIYGLCEELFPFRIIRRSRSVLLSQLGEQPRVELHLVARMGSFGRQKIGDAVESFISNKKSNNHLRTHQNIGSMSRIDRWGLFVVGNQRVQPPYNAQQMWRQNPFSAGYPQPVRPERELQKFNMPSLCSLLSGLHLPDCQPSCHNGKKSCEQSAPAFDEIEPGISLLSENWCHEDHGSYDGWAEERQPAAVGLLVQMASPRRVRNRVPPYAKPKADGDGQTNYGPSTYAHLSTPTKNACPAGVADECDRSNLTLGGIPVRAVSRVRNGGSPWISRKRRPMAASHLVCPQSALKRFAQHPAQFKRDPNVAHKSLVKTGGLSGVIELDDAITEQMSGVFNAIRHDSEVLKRSVRLVIHVWPRCRKYPSICGRFQPTTYGRALTSSVDDEICVQIDRLQRFDGFESLCYYREQFGLSEGTNEKVPFPFAGRSDGSIVTLFIGPGVYAHLRDGQYRRKDRHYARDQRLPVLKPLRTPHIRIRHAETEQKPDQDRDYYQKSYEPSVLHRDSLRPKNQVSNNTKRAVAAIGEAWI